MPALGAGGREFESRYPDGVLAHLARARHWQCRGERFESAILHLKGVSKLLAHPIFFTFSTIPD